MRDVNVQNGQRSDVRHRVIGGRTAANKHSERVRRAVENTRKRLDFEGLSFEFTRVSYLQPTCGCSD